MSQQVVNDGPRTEDESMVDQGKELVQEHARAARGAVGQRIGEQVGSSSKQLGGQLLEIAHGLARTSHGLRAEGKDQPAGVLEAVTSRAEGLGNYLTHTAPDRMLHDFEHFGRRRPWVAIAGGIALGFVTSRFLKASSTRRFDDLRAQGYTAREPWPVAARQSDLG